MSMSSATTTDPYEFLKFSQNPDGTLTRRLDIPETPPTPDDPTHTKPVLSKDVTLNKSNNTWVRIFLPTSTSKLPLIVYYHGGGFVLGSPSMPIFHDFCSDIAENLGVVIVSIKYRLAPEHRLPAAYEDAVEALHWIKTTQDDWLKNYADLSNCFIMGTSAGATIAYHVGLRASVEELQPLNIRGLILHQPYFGGSERSGSEIRLVNDKILPLCVNDLNWELSLPVGADRDHEYCNPTVGGGSELLEKIKSNGWKVMLFGCQDDPLVDREIELAKLMEEKGVKVVSHFVEGGCHGYGLTGLTGLTDLTSAARLEMLIKDFL